MSVQMPVSPNPCPVNKVVFLASAIIQSRWQGCGKYPREIKGGIWRAYCSKTCARRCSTNDPGICALRAAASPSVGGFCSMAHAGYAPHTGLCPYEVLISAVYPREWSHIPSGTPAIRPPGILKKPRRHRILFYHKHDPHYGFTNFSYHPVVYKDKIYPTSEHLFQSFKVCVRLPYVFSMSF
jgi:hypothetical protein